MTLEQRLGCVRAYCLLDHDSHRHQVNDLVRRGLAVVPAGCLPQLTAAGLEEWQRLGRVRVHGDDPEGR